MEIYCPISPRGVSFSITSTILTPGNHFCGFITTRALPFHKSATKRWNHSHRKAGMSTPSPKLQEKWNIILTFCSLCREDKGETRAALFLFNFCGKRKEKNQAGASCSTCLMTQACSFHIRGVVFWKVHCKTPGYGISQCLISLAKRKSCFVKSLLKYT